MFTFERFWNDLLEWSQKTFGPTSLRGPSGPLKHLAKELLVEILGCQESEVAKLLSTAKEPSRDIMEYVDMQFLVFDAAMRADHGFGDFIYHCFKKLDINRQRRWGPQTADQPTEHIRDGEKEAAAGT